MVSFISSFEIINVVVSVKLQLEHNVLHQFLHRVADAAALNTNGTKILLVNGVTAFFINGKAVVINSLRKLKNLPF